jgi:hypothetical protein
VFGKNDQKAQIIANICRALSGSVPADAVKLLGDYQFQARPFRRQSVSQTIATRVFVRDGFIDQYSGQRLIFPPVLRILSEKLTTAFPFHPNWKTHQTHPAYWELGATIDHVTPVTHEGGQDLEPRDHFNDLEWG